MISPVHALDLALFQSAGGYDLRSKADRKRSTDDLERLFFRIVRELSPDLFIEAGAKNGSTSRRARRYLPEALITAFEANPMNFARYSPNFESHPDRISYLHQALSDADGEVTFNVRIVDGRPAADGQGSLLTSENSSSPHKVVTVPAVRLDSHFSADSFDRCAVWMDVEGASKQVLEGGSGILDKIDALFIEVEDRVMWDGQWLGKDVMAFLLQYDLVPFARDYQSRYQYNVLFLKRPYLDNARVRLFFAEYLSMAYARRCAESPDSGRGDDKAGS